MTAFFKMDDIYLEVMRIIDLRDLKSLVLTCRKFWHIYIKNRYSIQKTHLDRYDGDYSYKTLNIDFSDFAYMFNKQELYIHDEYFYNFPLFKYLQRLNLQNVEISGDIPILENLCYLSLESCDGIYAIENQPKLQELRVLECENLRIVNDCPELAVLSATISGIHTLSNIPELEILRTYGTNIVSISGFLKLQHLEIGGDVSNISNLPNLKNLLLSTSYYINEVIGFPSLINLKAVDSPLAVLINLPNLRRLAMDDCPIEYLCNLPKLEYADINFCDLRVVYNLPELHTLVARDNQLSGVMHLPKLQILDVRINPDFNCIEDIPNLREFDCDYPGKVIRLAG